MQHLQPNTTLQGGKYRIERVLGQGGFGITYLAVQTSLNRYVAIKELFIGGSGQAINDRKGNQVVVTNSANQASFNQQKEKFKKEALRLASLNHPNLVKVHEFFEENGTAYYVMDYIEGESLRTKLNREGALSESLVLKYMQQLLPALDAAHKQSIWHLDIKPENIMIDRYGHVYLIDFGASKHIEHNSTLTTSLALAYTRGYCPPEIVDLTYGSQDDLVQALKEIGPWTDIYALGATMYNLLADSIPPSSNRLYKDGRNAFSFPSNISLSTQDLIVWMMKVNRNERPQSVQNIIKFIDNREKTIVDRSVIRDFTPYSNTSILTSNSEPEVNESSFGIKDFDYTDCLYMALFLNFIFLFLYNMILSNIFDLPALLWDKENFFSHHNCLVVIIEAVFVILLSAVIYGVRKKL
ncbi:MAG: serine/threonine protein kinase [Prevotella sp.]|nr:serine/threonine protein kinase [Prevotella sp.]